MVIKVLRMIIMTMMTVEMRTHQCVLVIVQNLTPKRKHEPGSQFHIKRRTTVVSKEIKSHLLYWS